MRKSLEPTRQRQWRILATGFLTCCLQSFAASEGVITVGGEKQLFIDDLFVRNATNVSFQLHPAQKTGERILEPDKPWENASLNWFSVLRHDGKFRLWYECYDVEGWPTTNDTSFCYAESADGIHWSKPELNLSSYHGDKRNNILFRELGPPGAYSRVHGAGVFVDATAPPEARFKGVSQGMFGGTQPPYRVAGMMSPDGLHWTRLPKPICDVFADSQYSAFWDTRLDAFVLFGRVGGRGRAIGRSQSRDFTQFKPLALVLENESTRDLYNPAAIKYEHAANTCLMFPSVYDHKSDKLEIHLAASRDGVRWHFPDPNTPLIALGTAGQFDSGSLYAGQGVVRVEDELWHYYSGSPLKHEEATLELMTNSANRRIYSRAIVRLDRYVSVTAGEQEGSFLTPPLRFKGNSLTLNVAVKPGGSLRVGLLDEAGQALPGLALTDCARIEGDHIRRRVTWTTEANLDLHAARPVRLAFQIKNANLYSFQFGEVAR